MDRFRVKFPTAESYRQGLELVRGRVPLFVASEKRYVLSVGELPSDVREEVHSLGASVTLEARYDLEQVGG